MPTELVRAPGHDRRRSLGWLAAAWMEHFCIHGPGDIQGTPLNPAIDGAIPLSDELTKLTVDCYALEATGRRLYDSVFYSRAKGMDKSGQAARFACFEALGPCRFAGWAEGGEVFAWHDFRYVYEPGEPMGRAVVSPFLRIMATEEGQTGNVYDAIYENLREGPLREAFPRVDDVGLTRTFLPGGGEIRPSTASSSAKDGGLETWAAFDETHLYITPELRRMYATVRRNMGKRKVAEPWSFEPSTMYEPGRGSVAEHSHALARQIQEGKAPRQRLLFDYRYAVGVDFESEDSIRAGLVESYGGASHIGYDRLVSEILDPRNTHEDSTRFFFNQALASSGQAFDLARWKALAKPGYVIPDGAVVTIGFDGSRTRDATGIIATEVATGHQELVGVWENPGTADWTVPEDEVDAAMTGAFTRWRVWRAYCDPAWWESWIAAWAGRFGDKRVVRFVTNQPTRMIPVVRAYSNAINAGELSHDGSEPFTRHIGNAVRRQLTSFDDQGKRNWVIQKESESSPRKIDLSMGGCLSWQAYLDAVASGVLNQPDEWSGIYIPEDEDEE